VKKCYNTATAKMNIRIFLKKEVSTTLLHSALFNRLSHYREIGNNNLEPREQDIQKLYGNYTTTLIY